MITCAFACRMCLSIVQQYHSIPRSGLTTHPCRYRPLSEQSEKHPARACKVVLTVAYETNEIISYERRQAVLRGIEAEFGGTGKYFCASM